MTKKVIIISIGLFIILVISYFLYNKYFYDGELIVLKTNNIGTYHRQDCKFVKKSNINDIVFVSKETIARSYYNPCKACKPPYDTKYIKNIWLAMNKDVEEKRIQKEKKQSEITSRIEKYKKDFDDGKITNAIAKFDIKAIQNEEGLYYRYKNINDEPEWYKKYKRKTLQEEIKESRELSNQKNGESVLDKYFETQKQSTNGKFILGENQRDWNSILGRENIDPRTNKYDWEP